MEIEFVIRLLHRHRLPSERAIDIMPTDGLIELEKGAHQIDYQAILVRSNYIS